jgi:hypothetical protein
LTAGLWGKKNSKEQIKERQQWDGMEGTPASTKETEEATATVG